MQDKLETDCWTGAVSAYAAVTAAACGLAATALVTSIVHESKHEHGTATTVQQKRYQKFTSRLMLQRQIIQHMHALLH